MPSRPEGNQQSWSAQDVDPSLEVVCHAREAEGSATMLQPRHEEIALLMGLVDRAQGVVDELLSRRPDLRGAVSLASILSRMCSSAPRVLLRPSLFLVPGAFSGHLPHAAGA
jgi:hypothetical protein